jgi:uncharacterized membrane protein YhiD involved in acid resistance
MEQFYFAFALGIGFAVLAAVSVMAVMAFFKVNRLIKQVIEVENNLIRGMEDNQRDIRTDIGEIYQRISHDREQIEIYFGNVTENLERQIIKVQSNCDSRFDKIQNQTKA